MSADRRWLWDPADGRAASSMRRDLLRVLAVLIAWGVVLGLLGLRTLLAEWETADRVDLALFAPILLLAPALAARAWRSHWGIPELGAFAVLFLLASEVQSRLAPMLSISARILQTIFLIAVAISLVYRWAAAVTVLALAANAVLGYQGLGIESSNVWLVTLTHIGLALGCSALVGVLVAAARASDEAAARVWELRRQALEEETRFAATEAVRRVLHDDVLSALRVVSGSVVRYDEDEIKRHCRLSLEAVADLDGVGP